MSSEATKGSLAVIGDRESVMLFRVLGVQTVTAETAEDTARAIHRLAKAGCSVIYLTEELAQLVPEELVRYQSRTFPAIILRNEADSGEHLQGRWHGSAIT